MKMRYECDRLNEAMDLGNKLEVTIMKLEMLGDDSVSINEIIEELEDVRNRIRKFKPVINN